MFKKLQPWKLISPQLAHDLTPYLLPLISRFAPNSVLKWNSKIWETELNPQPHFKNSTLTTSQNKISINFANPMGIAGGVDKNGTNILDWQKLGCGFIEVGTITPLPQKANEGKIVDRNFEQKSLWNKMGFPSLGAEVVHQNILKVKKQIQVPLFINIGKNRTTSNQNALNDYLYLIRKFDDVADLFVINISSPNTKGLRELFSEQFLEPFLTQITSQTQKPCLLKLSPDLDDDQFTRIIASACKSGIKGFILTNTTTDRTQTPQYSTEGGVSGLPLKQKSISFLAKINQVLGNTRPQYLVISAGGIIDPEDIIERLHLGADLVQIYSGLVFYGPNIFRDVVGVQTDGTCKN